MFGHNFKYTFKVLMRNRMLLFWTFVFPLVLGTMFKLAFSNIENSEKLNVIPIAIVDNEDFQGNEAFRRTFETLSDESSDEQMFDTVYVSKDEADTLLSDGDVDGVLYMNGAEPEIWIHENGINQTVLQYVVDEIVHTSAIMEKRVQNEIEQGTMPDIEALYKDVMEQVAGRESNLVDASRKNLSYTMIEYYTLIAMACLYGGILGMTALSRNLPNMGNLGKRTAIVPISKAKTMFSSLLAAYCTQLIGLAILFVYTIFVMKVDYGENLPYVILLALAGSLAGLTLAIMVTTVVKTGENGKLGILIGITMACCFLGRLLTAGGMMGITMKYIIEKHVPFLDKINPAAMITDGYYALYYYGVDKRFWMDVASLGIFSAFMLLVSAQGLRRQKYDSI